MRVYVHTKLYTFMFIEALFVIVIKNQNVPQQVKGKQLWYTHAMKYHLAMDKIGLW
jgi:hypothetical protein